MNFGICFILECVSKWRFSKKVNGVVCMCYIRKYHGYYGVVYMSDIRKLVIKKFTMKGHRGLMVIKKFTMKGHGGLMVIKKFTMKGHGGLMVIKKFTVKGHGGLEEISLHGVT